MESFSGNDAVDETEGAPDLITHVALDKMTTHDKDALLPALTDTEERDVAPRLLLADTHYGSKECVQEAISQDVELLSPVMTAKGKKQKKLTLEDFDLDESGRVRCCPQGHQPEATSVGKDRFQVCFDQAVCAGCAVGGRCPAFSRTRFQYTHERVRTRTKRLVQRQPHFRKRYRMRSGIEATISRYKHQMKMSGLRVRGLEAVRHRAILRALGMNIFRVTAWRQSVC